MTCGHRHSSQRPWQASESTQRHRRSCGARWPGNVLQKFKTGRMYRRRPELAARTSSRASEKPAPSRASPILLGHARSWAISGPTQGPAFAERSVVSSGCARPASLTRTRDAGVARRPSSIARLLPPAAPLLPVAPCRLRYRFAVTTAHCLRCHTVTTAAKPTMPPHKLITHVGTIRLAGLVGAKRSKQCDFRMTSVCSAACLLSLQACASHSVVPSSSNCIGASYLPGAALCRGRDRAGSVPASPTGPRQERGDRLPSWWVPT